MLEAPMLADAQTYAQYLYMPAIIITGTNAVSKPLSDVFFVVVASLFQQSLSVL